MKKIVLTILFVALSLGSYAQIGEHRHLFSIGGNAGFLMSNVDFVPKVSQGYHGGPTFGFSARYTCEKYFKTICSLAAEVNFAQLGWKEKILDIKDQPLLIEGTTTPMEYQRSISYIQIPIFAHLAWGRETNGFNGFVNLGPQFGFCLGENTSANFNLDDEANVRNSQQTPASSVIAQHKMKVENSFDYGIAAGAGIECAIPKLGRFLLEGRYYYGLGNIYGDTKRDYFGRSAFSNIVIKASYLFDL